MRILLDPLEKEVCKDIDEKEGERSVFVCHQQVDLMKYFFLNIPLPLSPVMAITWLAPQPTSTVSWSNMAGTSLGWEGRRKRARVKEGKGEREGEKKRGRKGEG